MVEEEEPCEHNWVRVEYSSLACKSCGLTVEIPKILMELFDLFYPIGE